MGQLLIAGCPCGYRCTNIALGGNKSNHLTVCMAPALVSGELEILNYFDYKAAPSNSGAPIFYNDAALQRANTEGEIQWGDFVLNRRNNFCPSCLKFTLAFSTTHFTD